MENIIKRLSFNYDIYLDVQSEKKSIEEATKALIAKHYEFINK